MSNLSEMIAREMARAERAQAILLAAVIAAGGRWQRKTTLWKAFWWAHLECMKQRGSELSDYPVVRLPQGPAPNDGDLLIESLVRAGLMRRSTDEDPRHPSEVFLVADMVEARQWVAARLTQDEVLVIDGAAQKFKGMTARAASDFSHHYSAEWNALANGKTMNIYRDLVPPDAVRAAVEATLDAQEVLAQALRNQVLKR